jgi:hypothetical protein
MGYNVCSKCMASKLELTRLEEEPPENHVLHRYHRLGVIIYHLKSPQDGYESLVVAPKRATFV